MTRPDARIVRIVRSNGTVTYRGGSMTEAQAEREAAAWREHFPAYNVTIHRTATIAGPVAAWTHTVRRGGQVYA